MAPKQLVVRQRKHNDTIQRYHWSTRRSTQILDQHGKETIGPNVHIPRMDGHACLVLASYIVEPIILYGLSPSFKDKTFKRGYNVVYLMG